MKLWKLAACVPLVFAAASVQAEVDSAEVQQILTKNACLACHKVDAKVVGPSYRDVADKYKDEADGAETLAKHIKQGSSGIWGPIPMPPNAAITDDDLTKVVDWIMAGAPE